MSDVVRSTAHGDKLRALAANAKLPDSDRELVLEQIRVYNEWTASMDSLSLAGSGLLSELVTLLNRYKKKVEHDLIFCSPNDFLYRQKGQLKLDNTILEEFLPRLFDKRLVPGLRTLPSMECGSRGSFAGLSFENPFLSLGNGAVYIKKKDQDFSVGRKHIIRVSLPENESDMFEQEVHVSFFASEVKTNLDKTMFQEAAATAGELKRASPGSKYLLLCEWLDMAPINTRLTAIDEVIVLRKAKRLQSNIRESFSNAGERRKKAQWHSEFLDKHPLSRDGFERFVFHLNECFPEAKQDAEDIVLRRGYF